MTDNFFKKFEMDETDFTGRIREAIEGYLKEKIKGRHSHTITPGIKKQTPEKIDENFCVDLITSVNKYSLLLLEMKWADIQTWQLRAFDEKQDKYLKALERLNVPVRYCYNQIRQYQKISDEEALSKSATSKPSGVVLKHNCLIERQAHVDVKRVLDEMLKWQSDKPSVLGTLTDLGLMEDLNFFTTDIALFVYNADENFVFSLNKGEIRSFAEIMQRLAPVNKEMLRDKDLSVEQLVEILGARANEVQQAAVKLHKHKQREAAQSIVQKYWNNFTKNVQKQEHNSQQQRGSSLSLIRR